ncbi:Sensor histidine kinase YehU [Enhygromyxa salina]|uniref:Sensor histidine kinase YehU n=1 Tax=Enhygromyxa salina TaxID=215803 RepID=A0A2S9XFP9_9BACT|nr:Sensor histidine kinase YehU [Enhygromyxa salina]
MGIPSFGLLIPRVTPLLDGVGPGQLAYWLGTLWFLGLAAAIWHGNRWLLFEQRRHYGWFNHPLRKLSMLLAAIVLYTTPITVVALLAWYGWSNAAADWEAIRTVALINVICVVFVTHAYETVFLIKEREGDLLRVARLDRARAEAELSGFLAQVDPHFLFNSLNTLGHLIETDARRAVTFNQGLAGIYRYLLRQRGRSLVPLDEELRFARAYLELMQIRYGEALRCELPAGGPALARLPPTALQLLIENAIKHNEVGAGSPLEIVVGFDELAGEPSMLVSNRRRTRRSIRESAGTGLRNLDERSKLAVGRGIQVEQRDDEFRVRVPLMIPAHEGAL